MGMGLLDESNGNSVAVGADRRALVTAIVEDEITHVSSEHASAFVLYGRRNFAAALTDESVFYMKYTGSRLLKIHSITLSSDSANAKAEVFYDPAYVSGGTALSIDINLLNQNRQSSKTLDVVAYHGNVTLVLTTDPNFEVLDVRLNHSSFEKQFKGLILGKNDAIGIIGSVAVIAEKIRCMVECYEVD